MKRKKQSNHFTIETRTIIEEELNQVFALLDVLTKKYKKHIS